jgi:exonuclease SbcD
MKLIHLSDLHIGKRVNEFSMIEDQKHILSQILSIVDQVQPEGVILAGDIYDKSVPSAEAVQLFDDFLTKLADKNTSVFIISGNHDSAERLAFGAQLMSSRGVYVSPVYNGVIEPIILSDSYGEVNIYILPFIKPAIVRQAFEDEKIESYQDAMATAINHIEMDCDKRNVLVCHQFVTGAKICDSEELSVGGIDQVAYTLFDSFDYVALGHIHSPQHVGRETVRYCGTPLKYSFSEADQEKSVTIIELKEKGCINIEKWPLTPLRDMRKIRGSYMDVTALQAYEGTNTDDYIQVTLTDEEDIPDGMQKLRVIYPNLMRLEYDNKRTREGRQIEAVESIEERSPLELFEEFYELQNNQLMNEKQREVSQKIIEALLER